MRNFLLILIPLFFYSCQVLEKREIPLSATFCKTCQQPLKELLMKVEGVYVVKYQENNMLFYNYDENVLNVDSLENLLVKKGYLPREDSIVMYPVCCNRIPKRRKRRRRVT